MTKPKTKPKPKPTLYCPVCRKNHQLKERRVLKGTTVRICDDCLAAALKRKP